MQWQHTFRSTWMGRLILLILLVSAGASLLPFWLGEGEAWVFAIVGPVWLLMAWLFTAGGVRVTLHLQELSVRLWPFPGRRVQLADLAAVRVVRFRPLRDYGGWGLRGAFGSKGMAVSVAGSVGVRLDLRDGRHLLFTLPEGDLFPAAQVIATAAGLPAGEERSMPPVRVRGAAD